MPTQAYVVILIHYSITMPNGDPFWKIFERMNACKGV